MGGRLQIEFGLHDFDSAAEALPEILRTVTRQYVEEMNIIDTEGLMIFEALLAGWSEAAGRMRIYAFRSHDNYELFADDPIGLTSIPALPDEYVPRGLAGLPVDRQLVGIMRAMRGYLADHPEAVPAIIGGEIMLTEVTRAAVSTKIVFRFEDFEATRIAAAAVAARYLRGDATFDVENAMFRMDPETGVGTYTSPSPDADTAVEPAAVTSMEGLSRPQRRRLAALQRRTSRVA